MFLGLRGVGLSNHSENSPQSPKIKTIARCSGVLIHSIKHHLAGTECHAHPLTTFYLYHPLPRLSLNLSRGILSGILGQTMSNLRNYLGESQNISLSWTCSNIFKAWDQGSLLYLWTFHGSRYFSAERAYKEAGIVSLSVNERTLPNLWSFMQNESQSQRWPTNTETSSTARFLWNRWKPYDFHLALKHRFRFKR